MKSSRYEVSLKKSAIKELDNLSDIILRRIQKVIMALSENPRPHGCKKLKGRDDFRVRVGDYRVLYYIDDNLKIVEVTTVKHRRDVYD